MLGRLFHAASSTATSPSGTRPSTSQANESEDIHTRNLLYPDPPSLASSFHSSYGFSNGGASQTSLSSASSAETIDLDSSRDVRVIIAQDGSTPELKAVLYDSKPSPAATTGAQTYDESPVSPSLGGPYGRARRRMPPAHASGADELRIFTDCMFGNSTLAYKGPSTKVHILPHMGERRLSVTNANSPISSRRGSLRGNNNPHANFAPTQPSPPITKRRKSVLITRLFSVAMPPSPTTYEGARNIASSTIGDETPTPLSSVGSNNGFPFPKVAPPTMPTAPKLVKPPRTSMYAVGLIISLPSASPTSASASLIAPFRYESDSGHRQDFYCPTPPSYEDDYPALPPGSLRTEYGLEDLLSSSTASDGRMDLITTHWDVITRALSDLQRVAQARILANLKAVGLTSPQPAQNGFKYSHKIELRKMALMRDDAVRGEAEHLRWRVVSGIKVPRVVVGQGRWDVWQEEAKWANNRFGGRDMNFFFLTLLTAFLGHHTGWLDVLGPESYKRRHIQQCLARQIPEETAVSTRTVLLSNDRIAARRLIYLLSAFLPAKPHQTLDVPPPPSRTSSINYLSQSPPNFSAAGSSAAGSKIGSLRKKAKKKPSKLNMVSNENDTNEDMSSEILGWDIPRAPVSGTSSAAASVLQVPLAPHSLKKSGSGGTLTTALSSATIVQVASGSPQKSNTRPGSRDSSASLNLMSTLRRTGTANTSADSNDSKWGSFLSYWSNPKSCSSTATSEPDEHIPAAPLTRGNSTLDDTDIGSLCLDDHIQQPFSPILPLDEPIRCSVDANDGTINVDVPLFSSPISSPPSISWLGGPPLTFSSPKPPKLPAVLDTAAEDPPSNVAGFIEDDRFHPDFLLQALRPSPSVIPDIKTAMLNEPLSSSVLESETLIADSTTLTITRLRLRPGTPDTWDQETVCDVDDTLATAIEKVIGVVPAGGNTLPCEAAVLGALAKVVRDVEAGGGCNVLTEGIGRWLGGVERDEASSAVIV